MRRDARNTLTAVYEKNGTGANVEVARYDYDYNLMRIRRKTATENVEYVLDDKHVLNELDASGNSIRRYHYGTKVLAVTESAGTSYVLNDGIGSASDFWSSTGTLKNFRQYDAWGNFRNGTAPAAGEAKVAYTGHQYDPETGWVYAKARYYDSGLGVFLSRDQLPRVGAEAPNLYLYALGNPLRYWDPTGFEPINWDWREARGNAPIQPTTDPTMRKFEIGMGIALGALAAIPVVVFGGPVVVGLVIKGGGAVVVGEGAIDAAGVAVGAAGCAGGDQRSCLEASASALDLASGPLNPTSELVLANKAANRSRSGGGSDAPDLPDVPTAKSPVKVAVEAEPAGAGTGGLVPANPAGTKAGTPASPEYGPAPDPLAKLTSDEIDASTSQMVSRSVFELPAQNPKTGEGLKNIKTKADESKDIAYHINASFKGIKGAPGGKAEVRYHSANPNAPAGTYSHDNPTVQVNSVSPKEYRLPDGTYKPITAMTPAEKEAAHAEAGQ